MEKTLRSDPIIERDIRFSRNLCQSPQASIFLLVGLAGE